MSSPVDAAASEFFRDGLRDKRLALRSGMKRSEIDAVEIVQGEDLDVAATRQVLKVGPAISGAPIDSTDEIDAADVLEAIALPPPAVAQPAVSATALEQAWPIVNEQDAFAADLEPISTSGVTFDFANGVGLPMALVAQRRLAWALGTVLACVVALFVGEAVASGAGQPPPAAAAAPAGPPFTLTPSTPAASDARAGRSQPLLITAIAAIDATSTPTTSSMTTIDVRSLPGAPVVGTIVAPSGALLIDGKRVRGTTAVVACGPHIVKTSRTKARPVDVPCSGVITVP